MQEFLANAGLEAKQEVNAKKEALKGDDALALVQSAWDLYAAKGKTVVHLNLRKEMPDAATLEKLILGPTGNLRAPTLRTGKTLIVGFAPEMYEKVFGLSDSALRHSTRAQSDGMTLLDA